MSDSVATALTAPLETSRQGGVETPGYLVSRSLLLNSRVRSLPAGGGDYRVSFRLMVVSSAAKSRSLYSITLTVKNLLCWRLLELKSAPLAACPSQVWNGARQRLCADDVADENAGRAVRRQRIKVTVRGVGLHAGGAGWSVNRRPFRWQLALTFCSASPRGVSPLQQIMSAR